MNTNGYQDLDMDNLNSESSDDEIYSEDAKYKNSDPSLNKIRPTTMGSPDIGGGLGLVKNGTSGEGGIDMLK